MPVAARRRPGRPADAALTSRRREQILDAAARVFARSGYAGTDVQVVADRLGVGKGTIYRYFPTKEALFLATLDRGMRLMRAEIHKAADRASDPLERLARAVRAYLAFLDAHAEFPELLVQERAAFKDRKKPTYFEHREVNVRPWQELLRGLIAQGRIRDVPVERITDVLGAAMYGTMFTNHFAGRRKPSDEQARDILDIVFRGILSESERARKLRPGAGGQRNKGGSAS